MQHRASHFIWPQLLTAFKLFTHCCYPLIYALLFLSSSSFSHAALPTLGDPTHATLNNKDEQQMGLAFYRTLQANLTFIDDIQIKQYLNSIANRLVSYSTTANQHFTFFIIEAPTINAFAGPAGYIGVHSELLLQAQNESQFASVLAHEIAHVSQRHLARAIDESTTYNSLAIAALLAAIVVGAKNPEAGQAILFSGVAGSYQKSINFIRSNESEADRIGINILIQSKINPQGSVDFFETLLKDNPENGYEYLRTHPLTTSRIAEAKSHLTKANKNLTTDSLDFQFARARLATLLHISSNRYLKTGTRLPLIVKQYQQALIAIQNRKYKKAIHKLKSLTKKSQHPWIQLALAKSYYMLNDNKQALQVLNILALSYPNYLPVTIALAESLNKNKNYNRSITLLKKQQQFSDEAIIYKTLAKTYFENGQIASALEATGDQYVKQGYLELAIQQYDNALKQKNLNASAKKRLLSSKEKIKKLKEKEAKHKQ